MKRMAIVRRGKMYYLRKRVPRRFADVESRSIVHLTLKTDSLEVAQQKHPSVWAEMIEAWEQRLEGNSHDAEKRFAAARNIAQRRGFRFMPASEVADLPRDQFFARVSAAAHTSGDDLGVDASATFGGPLALLVLQLLILIPLAQRMGMEEIAGILNGVITRLAGKAGG